MYCWAQERLQPRPHGCSAARPESENLIRSQHGSEPDDAKGVGVAAAPAHGPSAPYIAAHMQNTPTAGACSRAHAACCHCLEYGGCACLHMVNHQFDVILDGPTWVMQEGRHSSNSRRPPSATCQ